MWKEYWAKRFREWAEALEQCPTDNYVLYRVNEIKDYLNSKPVNKFDCTGEQKLQDMYEAHLKQTQNTYGQNPNNFKNRFEPQVF
jgi:hypothetical protein